jgi:hypothetical protein
MMIAASGTPKLIACLRNEDNQPAETTNNRIVLASDSEWRMILFPGRMAMMCPAIHASFESTSVGFEVERQRAAELDVLSKLVTQVPVRRIVPPSDPARLWALCDLILKDAERQLGRQALAAGSGR